MNPGLQDFEPVLVLGFNRPHLLGALLRRLQEGPPFRLYVALDGPRSEYPGDVGLVQECRDEVESLDWPSEVRTLFQEKNRGCGASVTAALTWFFEQEERGIVLEDDILPDLSFLPFCSELLRRYEHDDRVFAISGSNVVPATSQSSPDLPYRFSQVTHVWGWATWRRSWLQHKEDMSDWREQLDAQTLWERTGRSLTGALFWGGFFDLVRRGVLDTWDVQFVLAGMRAGQLTATANVNLTENTGGGHDATHENSTAYAAQPVSSVDLPLVDVPVVCDDRADEWTRIHHFQATVKARQAIAIRDPYFQGFVEDIRRISSQRESTRR